VPTVPWPTRFMRSYARYAHSRLRRQRAVPFLVTRVENALRRPTTGLPGSILYPR